MPTRRDWGFILIITLSIAAGLIVGLVAASEPGQAAMFLSVIERVVLG